MLFGNVYHASLRLNQSFDSKLEPQFTIVVSFASFDAQLLLCSFFLRTASSTTGGAVLRLLSEPQFTIVVPSHLPMLSYSFAHCFSALLLPPLAARCYVFFQSLNSQ
jgi:hypothetical protein